MAKLAKSNELIEIVLNREKLKQLQRNTLEMKEKK